MLNSSFNHSTNLRGKADFPNAIWFGNTIFSALKLFKFGFNYTFEEVILLLVGMVVAFIVSIISIKFLLRYVRTNDFKAFGWYRIILGLIVFVYFYFQG